MKHLYLSFILVFSLSLSAQVSNYAVRDCMGNSNSIYQALGTGKALIVTSNGFDCSICVSKAGSWGNWATANKASVNVWGAMTLTYSNAIPTCSQALNWVNSHGWSDIYTFIDSSEYFFEAGTPRYLVYSPVDSSLIYTGGSESQARNAASNAAASVTIKENSLETMQYFYQNGLLSFRKVPAGNTLVEIYNLAGKKERTFTLRKDRRDYPLSDLPKGIYLMRMTNEQSAITRKIVVS